MNDCKQERNVYQLTMSLADRFKLRLELLVKKALEKGFLRTHNASVIAIRYVASVILLSVLSLNSGCRRADEVKLFYEEYRSSDAKFFSDGYVIANKDGSVRLLRIDDRSEKILGCVSNWSDYTQTGNGYVIAYSNGLYQFGICRLDENMETISNEIIFIDKERLMIDPSILLYEGTYYLTLTHITGSINNADPDKENGLYTVSLYESRDLKSWETVTDIISARNNIEDVELFAKDGKFYLMYEKEEIDKGPSEIRIIESTDLGRTWINDKLLIDSRADNEPAKIFASDDGFIVFYSSDLENPNMSYMGSSARATRFDDSFNLVSDTKLKIKMSGGVLLYDAEINNGTVTLLYSRDYLATNDLCVESLHFR